jgi:hypothetical protein
VARVGCLFALLLIAATPLPPNQPKAHQGQTTAEQHHAGPKPAASIHNQQTAKTATEKTDGYTYNYYYPATKSESPPVWFQVVATIILLLFTGGLWFTSTRQWRAITAQAEIARDALRLEQRPWLVSTGDAQLGMRNGEIPEGPSLPVRFDLKNAGSIRHLTDASL